MGENGKFIVLRCYSGLPMRAPEMNPLSLSSHTLLLLALFRALSCLPALSTVENGRKADWKHKMAATRFESHNVGIIGASRSAERLSRLRHLVLERVAYKNEWAAVFTRRRAVLSLLHGASSNVHERKRRTFRSVLALFCQRTRLRRIAASASVRLLCCGKLFQRNALAPSEGKDGRYFLCLPSCTGRSPGFGIVAVYSGYRKHRSGRCKCAANCVFNCVEIRCILTVRKCGDDSCTVEQLESEKNVVHIMLIIEDWKCEEKNNSGSGNYSNSLRRTGCKSEKKLRCVCCSLAVKSLTRFYCSLPLAIVHESLANSSGTMWMACNINMCTLDIRTMVQCNGGGLVHLLCCTKTFYKAIIRACEQ